MNSKVDTYLMFKSFSVPYYYSMLFGWMPIRIPKNDTDKVFYCKLYYMKKKN